MKESLYLFFGDRTVELPAQVGNYSIPMDTDVMKAAVAGSETGLLLNGTPLQLFQTVRVNGVKAMLTI